ncbi:diguanylate cyclase domain-containing protein [Sphaerotilus mobilis]|uniref:PAS domain S-box-containing protein/diguanylate cyclase (GGDEF)-like protein n=1 Tax=Sphaerotilus mobilis TaxID=47994 RepID=A0A4Q7LWC7_9BURK|nr:diguanylate cyclase [Sphaerotilus mobilis]RZS58358.1 PAS domain S-box-containing protein/diguanylate cyclase (GGDEF)-like protein [Sphaerotilus mobilis]
MSSTEPVPLLSPTAMGEPIDVDIDPAAPERSLEAQLRLLAVQHPWLTVLVAALGAWFWSSMAMWLSRFPGQVAAIWYTNVWGLALLLVLPRRQWPGALLATGVGILGANLAYGDDLALAALLVLPNLVEMLLAVWLLQRGGDHRRLHHDPGAMLQVMLRGSLLPALLGTALAAVLVELTGLGPPGQIAWGWLDSSAVGSATLLPITLALLASDGDTLGDQLLDGRAAALALISVGVALLAILLLPFPYVYMVLPLALGAMRLGFVAVAAAVALVSLTVGTLIAQGLFPAPPQTAQWQQLLLYTPLLAALMPPLLLAASAEQVRRQTVALARSRERYRSLYERTPAMMVSVDRAGRLIGVSRLWLERMGLSQEDTLGRRLDDFLTEPARLLASLQVWPTLLTAGRCRDVELQLARHDGQSIDVLVSASTDRSSDGRVLRAHIVLEDITRKRLAEQLAAEHLRSKVTLESIADAVITSDARGRITYLNPVALTLLGQPEAVLLGRPYGEALGRRHIDEGDPLPDPVALCLQQRRRPLAPQRVRLAHAGGGDHVVQESVSPMLAEGQVIGVVTVLHDVTEAHALALQLAHRAQHDALTGLPNRLLLHDRLVQALQMARRQRRVLALMFIDLDGFKGVNDRLGHASGDALLCQVAGRLLEQLRASDTACRLGGDEFVVLLPQVESVIDAGRVAHNLLEAISRPYALAGTVVQVGASIGVACHPEAGYDESALMRNADSAMYEAKQRGRNRVLFFTPPATLPAP